MEPETVGDRPKSPPARGFRVPLVEVADLSNEDLEDDVSNFSTFQKTSIGSIT